MEKRVSFNYTCKNLQEVVYTKVKWGIDSLAMPHDLSKQYAAEVDIRTIRKMAGNLIWLKGISYPFKIPTNEELLIQDTLFVTVVKVNNEWFIQEFSLDKPDIRKETLV